MVEIDSLDDGQCIIKKVSSKISYHVEGAGNGKVTERIGLIIHRKDGG